MNVKQFLRLCSAGRPRRFNDKYRFYSNRNILRLYERGMFQDIFPDDSANEVTELLNGSPQCAYAGFDPTADSLHVGNLLVLVNLLHWQRSGHQAIALLGGATGLIGDPSHRVSERTELKQVMLQENLKSIRKNIETLFENHEKFLWGNNEKKVPLRPPKIVNNMEWYSDINVIEFVKNVGKYFRLGTMLGKSSVQSRITSETGMSFAEFTYQIFQAYDWLHLLKTYNCRFQLGGNDQMGNIHSGHDLISKTSKKKVYGLTMPLLMTEGGEKFGKSAGNAVWLTESKSSSFQLYQFFIRSKDSEVEKLLKLFTFLPLGTIEEVMKKHRESPDKREAQQLLAEQVTLLVHGEDGLKRAERATEALYSKSIESLSNFSAEELVEVFQGATIVEIMPEPGLTAYQLAKKANCFKMDSDALRIIAAGGFYVNHQRITNIEEVMTPGIHILPNNLSVVRVGKRNYHIVKWLM